MNKFVVCLAVPATSRSSFPIVAALRKWANCSKIAPSIYHVNCNVSNLGASL